MLWIFQKTENILKRIITGGTKHKILAKKFFLTALISVNFSDDIDQDNLNLIYQFL